MASRNRGRNDPGEVLGSVKISVPEHVLLGLQTVLQRENIASFPLPSCPQARIAVHLRLLKKFSQVEPKIIVVVEGLPSNSGVLIDGHLGGYSSWIQGNGVIREFSREAKSISGIVTVYRPPVGTLTPIRNSVSSAATPASPSVTVVAASSQSPSLSLLRDVPALCDVVLRAAGRDFPAHRVALAARSPVFLAMFTRDFKEAKDKVVDIAVDCSGEAFAAFLDFLYTGTLGERDCGDTLQLLELGERYLMDDLKQQCVLRLLAVGNAAEAVELFHAALEKPFVPSEVRERAVAVIRKFWPAASKTDAWKRLVDTQPAAATALEAAFANVRV